MSETLPVDDVQEWLDDSGTSCGACGSSSLTVLETMYSSMMEDGFDSISPHRAKLECEGCGAVTENSLKESVVEEVKE